MRLIIAAAAIALAACSSRDFVSTAAPPARAALPSLAASAVTDSAAIRGTLDRWYAAMQAVDSAAILAPLTPQFLLLEDTLPLTGPALVARLNNGGTATAWRAEFSDLRTRIAGDVAWTTLKNHETSTARDGTTCQADFLETIVFVRDGARWLIDRYHAAALHPWKCARQGKSDDRAAPVATNGQVH
jgi:ketosteroid isomerase-like protein